ncbi:ADK-domain-containing protein [Mycena sanguinolenta]|uniref:ADK-domain-containing protein n=1 Tax=Mycena sanguinolenta TaxID=230812 RepID=A0A8H7D972_9AGAR|nr:ADK-domain-containing protein [Mycena sanguinolenta]
MFRGLFPNPLRVPTSASADDEQRFLRLVMFGKPGSGKGTLSARLVKKYDIVSLSTGDLLRQQIQERTEVGRQAEDIVAQGKLLPDDVMLKVVASKLDNLRNKHWILDGFPRTVGQGKLLDAHLGKQGTPLSLVVNLNVPDEVILSRIADRWVHLPSGRVYNLSYNPPKGTASTTRRASPSRSGRMITRSGAPLLSLPETFARRLTQFYASTSPLLAYYQNQTQKRRPAQHPHQLTFSAPHNAFELKTLSGTTSDEIWPQLDGLVRRAFPALRERGASPSAFRSLGPTAAGGGLEGRRRHSLSEAVVAGAGAGDACGRCGTGRSRDPFPPDPSSPSRVLPLESQSAGTAVPPAHRHTPPPALALQRVRSTHTSSLSPPLFVLTKTPPTLL